MRKTLQLTALSLAAAVALSLSAVAEEHHGGPPGGQHPGAPGGGHPGGGHPGPGPGGGHPGFHGGPGGGHPGFAGHRGIGERGYSFRGPGGGRRDIALFSPREREIWGGGHWHHDVRFGRLGYWYEVNGAWYFYDQPFVGPPAYVSEVEFFDADLGPPVVVAPAPVVVAPAPVVVAPAPVIVAPPPVVCVGPLCVR
jgi:hypothetical protein